MVELAGRTIGITGFGRIGQEAGRIAQALGMKVLIHGTCESKSLKGAAYRYVETDESLAASDVISLHYPLFPETRGIINREGIAKMKDGVMIINSFRGQLVVEEGLRGALNSGKVAGAAMDVASTEPIRIDDPLLMANNRITTPHISWASKGSRQRLMSIAVDNLRAYIDGKPVNVVNE